MQIVYTLGAKRHTPQRYCVGRYELTDSALPGEPVVEVWQEQPDRAPRWVRIWPPLRGQRVANAAIATKVIALASVRKQGNG